MAANSTTLFWPRQSPTALHIWPWWVSHLFYKIGTAITPVLQERKLKRLRNLPKSSSKWLKEAGFKHRQCGFRIHDLNHYVLRCLVIIRHGCFSFLLNANTHTHWAKNSTSRKYPIKTLSQDGWSQQHFYNCNTYYSNPSYQGTDDISYGHI